MTAWTADNVESPRTFPTTTVVLEAAGGIIRTVLGAMHAEELFVAVLADSPLCQALMQNREVNVIKADGVVVNASAQEDGGHAHAQGVLGQLQSRLNTVGGSSGPARVFRLVLGKVLGPERGLTPRT